MLRDIITRRVRCRDVHSTIYILRRIFLTVLIIQWSSLVQLVNGSCKMPSNSGELEEIVFIAREDTISCRYCFFEGLIFG